MNTSVIVWLSLMILFLVVEGVTVGLISLWFAGGALAALLAALLGGPGWLQCTCFVLVSAGLLLGLRPWVRKYMNPKKTATNADAIIGTQGYVMTAIDNVAASGQVKLGGMEWTARSTSGAPIPAGTLVRVDRIEGVKVFVTPAPEPANVR